MYFLPIRISDLVFKSRCMYCARRKKHAYCTFWKYEWQEHLRRKKGIFWEFIIKFDFR